MVLTVTCLLPISYRGMQGSDKVFIRNISRSEVTIELIAFFECGIKVEYRMPRMTPYDRLKKRNGPHMRLVKKNIHMQICSLLDKYM